jgi:pimeloyl-ACP methyl ester carboxylesterase
VGAPLSLRDWGGEGEPLLLLHGMAAHSRWWDLCAPALARGRRVVGLDFRGHGESAWDGKARYQFEDYAADVEAARLALGWERFDLVGHSLGARVAIVYARAHASRLRRLGALDFLAEFPPEGPGRFAQLAKLRQPVYPRQEDLVARFRLEPPGTTASPELLAEMARAASRPCEGGWTWRFDWRAFAIDFRPVWPELPELRAPTLILRGELSAVMPRPVFERAVAAVPGSRAVEIPGAHHHVPLDAPDELARTLEDFLA